MSPLGRLALNGDGLARLWPRLLPPDFVTFADIYSNHISDCGESWFVQAYEFSADQTDTPPADNFKKPCS